MAPYIVIFENLINLLDEYSQHVFSLLNINILSVCVCRHIHVCTHTFYREAKQIIAMSLKIVQLKQQFIILPENIILSIIKC